jgi:hypothetical protein
MANYVEVPVEDLPDATEEVPSYDIPEEVSASDMPSRESLRPDALKQAFSGIDLTPRGSNLWENIVNFEKDLARRELLAASGIGQRAEASMANQLTTLQEGKLNPLERVKASWQGFTGEKLGEMGDIYRNAGAPEEVASTLGLINSMALPGAGELAGAARIAALRGTAKVAGVLGKKGLNVGASIIHDLPDLEKADIIATKGAAFVKDRYFKAGALGDAVQNVAKQVADDFYKPAQAEWSKLGSKAKKVTVPEGYAAQLADELEAKYADAIKGGRDEGLVSGLVARLRKLGAPDEELGLLDASGKAMVGEQKAITLKDLLDAKADIRQAAGRSQTAMLAASDLSKRLADDFDIVKTANAKWEKYRAAEDALRRAGIKVNAIEGELPVDAANRVTSFYKDKFQKTRKALLGDASDPRPGLLQLYEASGTSGRAKFLYALEEMKKAIQASDMASRAPIGSGVAGRLVALPIGLGLAGSVAGGMGGALIGGTAGLMVSSPRTFAKMWRMSLRDNPRGKFMSELGNRALLEKGLDVGATAGVSRQLRGQE